ncbi:exported hypothetical protein [Xanthomonas citri pv. citri]|nr:exported hypothetical protein [Xanthomonas citri pv. citri]
MAHPKSRKPATASAISRSTQASSPPLQLELFPKASAHMASVDSIPNPSANCAGGRARKDAREALGGEADIRKAKGGWFDRLTGEFWPSPWKVTFIFGRTFAWKVVPL